MGSVDCNLKKIIEKINDERRSPSWGAWIETYEYVLLSKITLRRSPSWGAWIETQAIRILGIIFLVAPPRGERGLKHAARSSFRRP